MQVRHHVTLFVLWISIGFILSNDELGSFVNLNVFSQVVLENGHHRVRRDVQVQPSNSTCDITSANLPQPTVDYPAVLFEKLSFNDCQARNAKYIRIRANRFVKWSRNREGEVRGKTIFWKSMITFPGVNVTFRGCCPSGNDFRSIISNWTTYSRDINNNVLNYTFLRGSDGIWYEKWLYWVKMTFDVSVDQPQNTTMVKDCGRCIFGQCGITARCECLSGYTGNECDKSLGNATYPTQEKPLLLFPETYYGGTPIHLQSGESMKFAGNVHGMLDGNRVVNYKSMRVYHNTTLVFQRGGSTAFSTWKLASNIHNVMEFMESNPHLADPIWYTYANSIELEFLVKAVSIGIFS